MGPSDAAVFTSRVEELLLHTVRLLHSLARSDASELANLLSRAPQGLLDLDRMLRYCLHVRGLLLLLNAPRDWLANASTEAPIMKSAQALLGQVLEGTGLREPTPHPAADPLTSGSVTPAGLEGGAKRQVHEAEATPIGEAMQEDDSPPPLQVNITYR